MRQAALLFFFALIASTATIFAQTPSPKIVNGNEFLIAGIEARTSGEKEMSSDGVIPQMWQRFYQEHILDKIPNRADGSVYALYTDFSSNRMGEYTVVIGARVKDKSQLLPGFVFKTVPAGKYAVFTSDKGPASTVIPAAWIKVGTLEDKNQLGGKRAYKADFEVYGPAATDPQNLQANLYVGLK